MASKVMDGAERKKQLLEVGAKLAAKHGVKNVTRRMVAKAANVSEPLVANYLGSSADARKAYARKAKAMGLTLPTKDKEEAIGKKLRAHGPRDARDARPRSAKEVKAIKDKKATAAKKSVKRASAPASAGARSTSGTQAKSARSKKMQNEAPSNKMIPGAPENAAILNENIVPQGKFAPTAPPPGATEAVQLPPLPQ